MPNAKMPDRSAAARRFGLVHLLLLLAPAAFAQSTTEAVETVAVSPTHEWLVYVAIVLGITNLLLLYLLYRSPSRHPAVAGGEEGTSSSRTDKRMDKRKREIDELRQHVDGLTAKLSTESAARLTTPQIQELVRALVHDELLRSATHGSAQH